MHSCYFLPLSGAFCVILGTRACVSRRRWMLVSQLNRRLAWLKVTVCLSLPRCGQIIMSPLATRCCPGLVPTCCSVPDPEQSEDPVWGTRLSISCLFSPIFMLSSCCRSHSPLIRQFSHHGEFKSSRCADFCYLLPCRPAQRLAKYHRRVAYRKFISLGCWSKRGFP